MKRTGKLLPPIPHELRIRFRVDQRERGKVEYSVIIGEIVKCLYRGKVLCSLHNNNRAGVIRVMFTCVCAAYWY